MLLALSILASVILTRKAHKPIGSIIKNLTSTVDELNHKLEINKPIIRHHLILRKLNGKISSRNPVEPINEGLDVKFDRENFFCFIVKVFREADMSFQNEMLIHYNIIEALEETPENALVKAVINDDNIIAGIVNYNSEIPVERVCLGLLEGLDNLLNIKYTLCIGNSYRLTEEEFCKSYQEARECLKYYFIKTDRKVMYYHELKVDKMKDTGSSQKLLEKIEEGLRARDTQKIRFTLDGMMEAMKEGYYQIDYCRNSLMDVVSTIRNTVEGMGFDPDELYGYDVREFYKTMSTIDEFKVWVFQVIDIALEKLNEKRQSSSRDMEFKLKKYIFDHIYGDLSLDQVAEGLSISPGYLSRIFKTIIGMNFSDYVTKLKIEEAERLLREGGISVKDMAARLGYYSTQHFIKIFKQKHGFTPKEYQRNIKETT